MLKRRTSFTDVQTTHVVGILRTCRSSLTIVASGSVLKQLTSYNKGAEGKACFSVTHGILLPSALEALDSDDRIEKLVVTNTIPVPPEKRHPKIEVLSIAPLLAGIIQDIHDAKSISNKLVLR
jgi:ribose-phosphate pyrophosphokinase